MDMSKESNEVVLCVSNAYQKKFYLNENFNGLPQSIRDELKIMCVIYTEDIGGVLELVFDEAGNLELRTSCDGINVIMLSFGTLFVHKAVNSIFRV